MADDCGKSGGEKLSTQKYLLMILRLVQDLNNKDLF